MGNTIRQNIVDESRLNTAEEIMEQIDYNISHKPEYIGMIVDAKMSGNLTELLKFVRLTACASGRKINRVLTSVIDVKPIYDGHHCRWKPKVR